MPSSPYVRCRCFRRTGGDSHHVRNNTSEVLITVAPSDGAGLSPISPRARHLCPIHSSDLRGALFELHRMIYRGTIAAILAHRTQDKAIYSAEIWPHVMVCYECQLTKRAVSAVWCTGGKSVLRGGGSPFQSGCLPAFLGTPCDYAGKQPK
jgi:hypothetical protein